jgi:hypothetical protein
VRHISLRKKRGSEPIFLSDPRRRKKGGGVSHFSLKVFGRSMEIQPSKLIRRHAPHLILFIYFYFFKRGSSPASLTEGSYGPSFLFSFSELCASSYFFFFYFSFYFSLFASYFLFFFLLISFPFYLQFIFFGPKNITYIFFFMDTIYKSIG